MTRLADLPCGLLFDLPLDLGSLPLGPWLVPALGTSILSLAAGVLALFLRGRVPGRIATAGLTLVAALLVGSLFARAREANHLPGKGPFESLLWMTTCAGVAGALLALAARPGGRARAWIATVGSLLVGAGLVGLDSLPAVVRPLAPAFVSDLHLPHLAGVYLGSAFLLFAVVLSVSAWWSSRRGRPDGSLDHGAHLGLCAGFAFLTVGLVSGAHWSQEAWGNYQSWGAIACTGLAAWLLLLLGLQTGGGKTRAGSLLLRAGVPLVLILGATQVGITPGGQLDSHAFSSVEPWQPIDPVSFEEAEADLREYRPQEELRGR